MNTDSFSSASYEGAARRSAREMMKLTPAQRVLRAAELSEASRQLARAGEAARRKAEAIRSAKK